jgi:phosphopantothenoylcysteine decarboxylase/phosphopantothenate--cysteine ligase
VRIVVTAGPTRESIDPVRFISNRSSGKMGYAIAQAAIEQAHAVTLISGPVCLAPPKNARVIQINTSDELRDAILAALEDCDVLVMCAAVSDYRPASISARKLPKRRSGFALELAPTTDILAAVSQRDRDYLVVGFAAETHNLEGNARKKLATKNCDMIVANDVSRTDSGMDSDENELVIFCRDGESRRIARAQKKIIARELMKIICEQAKKVLTKKA